MKRVAASRFMSRCPRRPRNPESAPGTADSPAQRPHDALVRQRLLRWGREAVFAYIHEHNWARTYTQDSTRTQPLVGLGEVHLRGGGPLGRREPPILLSPASEIEPGSLQELGDFGKHRQRLRLGIDAAGGAARGLVGEPAADHEVFGHRQLREDAGILGRIADAAPGVLVRRELGDVLSAEANITRSHREETGDALDDGGTPRAVAPDQRD